VGLKLADPHAEDDWFSAFELVKDNLGSETCQEQLARHEGIA